MRARNKGWKWSVSDLKQCGAVKWHLSSDILSIEVGSSRNEELNSGEEGEEGVGGREGGEGEEKNLNKVCYKKL